MPTQMVQTTHNYRYPGSAPFRDTPLERRLFFGREQEAQKLLHTVLAENLVVLFAKSGIGKTSLLNAGLFQALRDREFLPLPVRFIQENMTPLATVHASIASAVIEYDVEHQPGPQDETLHRYFAAAEFWSSATNWATPNVLLTPVLILDQFEEFFTLHAADARQAFTVQLAELINEGQVKIVIGIREDYLGNLEELARDIPDILHNRFRLLPLQREQAREAIIQPAQIQDPQIATQTFQYAPDAVEAMLTFLCKRRERDRIVPTDEVEPFQLQLLCQNLEANVRERQQPIIQSADLGGESGMSRVLENFYDDQIKELSSWGQKRKVRKLCEKGFISSTNRRLSLEEEYIVQQFHVAKTVLNDLVNSRLLRADPRVGSIYYELSHDALVKPIQASQKKRRSQQIKLGIASVVCLCLMILIPFLIYQKNQSTVNKLYAEARQFTLDGNNYAAMVKYEALLKIDPKFVKAYLELGQLLVGQWKTDQAFAMYQKALENGVQNANIYYALGRFIVLKATQRRRSRIFRKRFDLIRNLRWLIEP